MKKYFLISKMMAKEIHDHIPNFACEICGLKLDENKMKDLIIFARGEIGNEMGQTLAFRESTHTIYIHKQCMKLLINTKFGKLIRNYFNNSI
jgi:hypothetical protein